MADLRGRPRVAASHRLTVRRGACEGSGFTENLSERGAMVSVEIEPALVSGERIELIVDLPGSPCTIAAIVRWTSSVLPGMTGIEFEEPVPAALTNHVRMLISGRRPVDLDLG